MTTTSTTTNTIRHTCNCKVCNGLAFTAPAGYITGTPKQVKAMVHNYAHMVRNPVMGPQMAARGLHAAQ